MKWFTLMLCLLVCIADVTNSFIDPSTTLGCHIRHYTQEIIKPWFDEDGNLHPCVGFFQVDSCWGRCDSNEIGDFKMPFKISNHPVCTYAGRTRRIVTLDHCIGHPEPEVELFDASRCECRRCNSEFESCENLNG
ncbi:hypothetical protein SNE40_010100 [Patella caerulea]|uniref:Glycoprotein hormone subunit beta domain-containing protein n=1 Tax=Patella caerulea TaxID=87958 RepID=A0AAN8PR81_PATCE